MSYPIRRLWRMAVFLVYQFHPRPSRRVEATDYRVLWQLAGLYER